MKVLLLEHPRGRSSTHFNDVTNTPLSSCLISGYVASLLQTNGVETEIFDSYLAHQSFSEMVAAVVEKECDILGIHLIYCWEHTPQVLSAIDEIKSRREIPVVIYGFFPTFAYGDILRSCSSVDYIIIGEPEMSFLQFCLQLQKGRDVSNVNGLVFRNGQGFLVNRRQKVIDNLDGLPFPIRTKQHLENIGGNILGSRGCYGNCTFCYINNYYGKKCRWRGRTGDNIYHEVQAILSNLSRRYLYFVDANFFGPGEKGQNRAVEIAEYLRNEKGLGFGLECRVNDVQEKSLSALTRAGLQDVFLGIESGSPHSLQRMRKGTTVEEGKKAIALLRNYGIEPYTGFIMFEPDSEMHDLRDNFNFLKTNNLLEKLTTTVDLLYHPQIVLMGTDTYKSLDKEDRMRLSSHSSYQGTYNYKDDRITFLSEVIFSICRYLLTIINESDSPLHWRRDVLDTHCCSHEIADKLNQWLVEYFEELLTRLERGEMVCNDDSKCRQINDAVDLINGIIGENRVIRVDDTKCS